MSDPVFEVGPNGPLTLPQAVAQAAGRTQAVIRLKSGLYRLSEPLHLTPDHKGLTIEAGPNQKPVLTGAVDVSGWKQDGPLWTASAPEGLAEKGSRLLMVNGQIRPRSRWPEEGTLLHESSFDVRWMSTTGGGWERKPTEEELTTLKYKEGDLGDWLDPKSAEVTVMHMWDESCVGIASLDAESRTVRFSSPLGHPAGAFGVKKYVVWNTAKGLGRPGSWFLDRTEGQIRYRPRPGERPEDAAASLGVLDTLIRIDGADGASLRGLTLEGCSVAAGSGGFACGNYPGAVTASGARGLRLEGLSITAVAGYGIKAVNCPESAVLRCHVWETGAGGIRLDGELTRVEDCTIERVGLQYPSGVGIWTAGPGAKILHNSVLECSYSGIIGAGAGSVIEGCRIDRPMLSLSDGAAVYVFGGDRVAIRGCIASRIGQNEGYGSSAFYLDEQSHDCVVEGCAAIGVPFPSQNHMAKTGIIRGCLFISEGEMTLGFARCSGYRLEGNVLIARQGIKLRAPKEGFASLAGNSWDPGAGSVSWAILEDYSEKAAAPIPGTAASRPHFSRPRPDLYEIKLPNQAKPLTWDMRPAGPRR